MLQVVDGVQEKLESLKMGRSAVVERGHTVVLGWSDETVTIVRELAMANESCGGGCIAVLTEGDKRAAEAELAALLRPGELRGSRVVFRGGSRLRASDLRRVATETARSVIVVSDARLSPHAADAEVLQVVLNVSTLRLQPHANVVAEVRVSDNEALLHLVSHGTVAAVSSHDLCGALMLQFARQPGLASVYRKVLGFEGSEFYVKAWPELEGRCFGELASLFPDAVPVGIVAHGGCVLNPAPHYTLQQGDALVVLAEDDDSYAPLGSASVGARKKVDAPVPAWPAELLPPDAPCFPAPCSTPPAPERMLLAGWRRDVPSMMMLLDRLVAPGSELHIMSDMPLSERKKHIADGGVMPETLLNLRLVHHVGNSAVRRQLEALPLERFTSMIIAADACTEETVINSDSHGLATLLLVRGIQAARRRRTQSVTNLSALDVDMPSPSASPTSPAVLSLPRVVSLRALSATPVQPARTSASGFDGTPLFNPRLPAFPAGGGDGSSHNGGAGFNAAPHRPAHTRGGAEFGFEGDVITTAADLPVVVEILDARTQRTVADSGGVSLHMLSEFMQSNELVSKILAMVSEDAAIKHILDQLLGGTGTQFAVTPSELYVSPDAAVSFEELAQHCSVKRRCVLCGYIVPAVRGVAGGPATPPLCVMNPPDKTARREWGGFGLVVIATDERLVQHRALQHHGSVLSRGWEDEEASPSPSPADERATRE